MSTTRRKWSTTWADQPQVRKSHRSETAVYEWIAEQAAALRDAVELPAPIVSVWVDEGRGWERYEWVDLRQHHACVMEVKQ